MQQHGDHYLKRVYTKRELEDCSTATGVDPERLAARFAAKEAALKVLRPGETGIPWYAIEVRRSPEGWVELRLDGPAAKVAQEQGITDVALSITTMPGSPQRS